MKKWLKFHIFLAIGLSSVIAVSALAQTPPCSLVDPTCKSTVEVLTGKKFELYRNYDLDTKNEEIKKLVLIIHGVGRNFGNSFARMNTVYSSRNETSSTLVIAPHFLADADQPASGYIYWGVHDWASGNDSLDTSHLSSYEVLDFLISKIIESGNFPNLREVIVTGLSAGGQVTERYAAGSAVEYKYFNIHFRYIIASPSSYMYFDQSRWIQGTKFQFAVPSMPNCTFNTYRYGMDGRNRYMNLKSSNQMTRDFRSRDIVVTVGDQDDAISIPNPPIPNDPKDGADLDVSCGAEFQGPSRLERATVFAAYLNFIFPEKRYPFIVGPGIAHQLKLYSVTEIQPWL